MRLKIIAAVLAASTFLTPVQARAEPITFAIVAGTAALQGAIGVTGAALLIGAAKFAAGALLSSLAAQALAGDQQRPTPPPQEVQSNFALEIPPRYLAYGVNRIGGNIPFAEQKNGRLFKLVAQCDSEVTEDIRLYLNDIPATFDAEGFVDNDEFVLDNGNKKIRIDTRPGTVNQASSSVLQAAFPEWTAQHVGAGVSDTLLRIDPVGVQHRHQIYRHRGALGLGEPDVSRLANYGRVYDPRQDSTRGGAGTQRAEDPSTWGPATGNLILIAATHRLDPERFAMHPDDINWQNIATQAGYCDLFVTDRYGQQVRKYHGAVLINKGEETNLQSENKILAACDAIRFEDEEGRLGFHVGHLYEPTLTLYDEDIYEIASAESDDGETSWTHLYGKYTEPEFDYKATTTAPWVNTAIWSPGKPIRNREVPLYEAQHHNHAVRLLKAVGTEMAAELTLRVLAGLRAKRARSERFLRLDLADQTLSGVYKIKATERSFDDRTVVPLTLVKIDGDPWSLDEGEEGPRPTFNTSVEIDTSITNIAPEDMDITVEAVKTSDGVGARLRATFPVPAREDRKIEIQHREDGDVAWLNFAVTTDEGSGASGLVADGSVQQYQWRVAGISGKSSGWSSIVEIIATADTVPPGDLSDVSFTVTGQDVETAWRSPNSANFAAVRVYHNTVDDFATASLIETVYHAPNSMDGYTDPGLTAGSHWFYLVPVNGSGWPGNATASGEIIIV